MIVQIDEETNTVCNKWYSIEKIKQHTSYNPDSIKKAIYDKKPYGGCIWLEYNNRQ